MIKEENIMKKYTTPSITLNAISTEEIMFLSVSNDSSTLFADWNEIFTTQESFDPGMDL